MFAFERSISPKTLFVTDQCSTRIDNKMASFCSTVKYSPLLDKAKTYAAKEFVWAEISSQTKKSFPFASDYKFSKCFLPKKYANLSERIHNFDVRSDDIWICAFPKSGSTWMSNIVWQLQNRLNFTADILPPYKLFERPVIFDVNDENKDDTVYRVAIDEIDNEFAECKNQPSPRLLKSHLPASLLPIDIWTKKPKLIYMYRDAKDVVISMYHMFCNHAFIKYPGTMEDFFDIFLNDHIIFGPFDEHVNSYRQIDQRNHVLLMSYEQMLANPFAAIKQISEFLNYSYSDDQLRQLTEHLSFENMRKRFVRPAIYSSSYKYKYLVNFSIQRILIARIRIR